MFNNAFLLEEKTRRKRVDVYKGDFLADLDKTDLKILTLLAPNARLPASEIAKKSLEIAADICIYTNHSIILEEIK